MAVKLAKADPKYDVVLSKDALAFLHELTVLFRPRVYELLAARKQEQDRFDAGASPNFCDETKSIREKEWTAAPLPADILDRRVELTGPSDDAKMVISALNSGANVYMTDFEDSLAPTWANVLNGQLNLYHAVRRTLTHTDANGKTYKLGDKLAVLFMRPRGWHLWEEHCTVEGDHVPAPFFDFALYAFHAAAYKKTGLYFYLPKMEHYKEARLWASIFKYTQDRFALPASAIRATVLIETLPAAFYMHEIIWELKDYSAGLNCGRWDYIFSYIKKLRTHPDCVLPDRTAVTMTQPFMRAYVLLLIQTCHRRGVHAMGGMSAYIPVKDNATANEAAFQQIKIDKLREVTDGHDGTWVAHPALIEFARKVFDAQMTTPNQIANKRPDVTVTAKDLLAAPRGRMSENELRQNIRVTLHYITAFLSGRGAVGLYRLMEDAATAEISRTQLWQWHRHGVMVDGRPLTRDRFETTVTAELETVTKELAGSPFLVYLRDAQSYLLQMTFAQPCPDFLTSLLYPQLISKTRMVPSL